MSSAPSSPTSVGTPSPSSSTPSSFLSKSEKEKLQFILTVLFYFIGGFFSYITYSVSNRKACELFPVPFFISFLQLFFGGGIFLFFSFVSGWIPISWIGNYQDGALPLAYHNRSTRNDRYFAISTVIKKVPLGLLLSLGICYGVNHVLNFYTVHTGVVTHLHFFMGTEPIAILALSMFLLPALPALSSQSVIGVVVIVLGTIFAHYQHFSLTNFHFFTCFLTAFCYQLYLLQMKGLSLQQRNEKEKYSLFSLLGMITLISASIILPLAYYLEMDLIQKYFHRYSYHEKDRWFVIENLITSTIALSISTYFNINLLDWIHPVTFSVGNSLIRLFVNIISIIVSIYHRIGLVEYFGVLASFVGYWIYFKSLQ